MAELLKQPEYIHTLVVPVLTHALPFAAVALAFALLTRRRAVVVFALALVAAGSFAVWPAVHYGHRGYDRVLEMADEPGGEWLDIHMHRAEEWQWLIYGAGVIALAAALAPVKWPRTAWPLAFAALLAAGAASFAGAYVASAGGKVRHREFRTGPPASIELEDAREENHHSH